MFYCEGCGVLVERKANIGRKPKPPFCRGCYCINRDWFKPIKEYKRKPCRYCSGDKGLRTTGHRAYCSKQCSDAGRRAVEDEYRALREAPLERDGWYCRACGVETPRELRGTGATNAPQIDHIIPRCQGGGDDDGNLQCLCRLCNANKSGRTMRQWVSYYVRDPVKVDQHLTELGYANAA